MWGNTVRRRFTGARYSFSHPKERPTHEKAELKKDTSQKQHVSPLVTKKVNGAICRSRTSEKGTTLAELGRILISQQLLLAGTPSQQSSPCFNKLSLSMYLYV